VIGRVWALKRAGLFLAVVATSVVGFVPPAHAVGAAACVLGGTITFTEAAASPGTGTWDINPGQIDCQGALNGYRIFGQGPFTGQGTYSAILPAGGSCLHQVGIGMVDYTFSSGAMVFHKQEAQKFIVAGVGELTTPTLRAALQLAPPYEGNCLTKPVTRATFAAQGEMLWTAPFFLDPNAGKADGRP